MATALLLCAGAGLLPAAAANLGETDPNDRAAELRATAVRVVGGLSECIRVGQEDERDYDNVTVKQVAIDVRQSVGACGCQSAP